MKSNLKLILITVGFVFVFSSIISTSLNFNTGASESTGYVSLKNSAVSERIHIIGNSGWEDFKNDGNCTGNGTYSEPYVIEDLVINGGGSGSCILIEDSNVYFTIENCIVYNVYDFESAAIFLSNVTNGQLINNTCSSNYHAIILAISDNITIMGTIANNTYAGIFTSWSNNNTISGNILNNNTFGIYIRYSHYNNMTGNTLNNNSFGIHLDGSNNNVVSENTANNNVVNGIYLFESDYNIVSGNTLIGNDECIVEEYCYGNKFSDNGSCTYGEGNGDGIIPGYSLFILLGILSIVAIIISKKLKKS